MICLIKNYLYLDDSARFAGIMCPLGWKYSTTKKLLAISIPVIRNALGYSLLSFIHRKWDRKNAKGEA